MKELLRFVLAMVNAINSLVQRVSGIANYNYYFVGPSKIANDVTIPGNPQRIGLYVYNSQGFGNFIIRIIDGSNELQIFVNYTDTPFELTYLKHGPIALSTINVASDGVTDITIIEHYKIYQ